MSTNAVKPVLFIGFLLLLAGAVMGQPAQSHPLSQIVPIDTDLDMAENSVGNVSELILDPGTEPEGLVLDDLTITHEGRAQKLILDYNNNEWRIEDSSLDINGNNISGFFGSACPGNEVVEFVHNNGTYECFNVTSQVQDIYVNKGGDWMTGSLDMGGNYIIEPGEIRTGGSAVIIRDSTNSQDLARFNEGGSVTIPSGSLDMQSNNIQTTGLVDGVDIGSPGNALIIDGSNSYAVDSSSLTMEELDNGSLNDKYVERSGDLMKGILDMNNHNINYIDTLNNYGTTLSTGGDIDVGSGTVTSTSEMCIGNEC